MEHTKIEPKHVADLDKPIPVTVVHRILVRILELSTLELIVAVLHLAITAGAVFGLIGVAGGGH